MQMILNRLRKIESELPKVISDPENIFFLTGFRTSARTPNQIGPMALVLHRGDRYLICPRSWEAIICGQIETNIFKTMPYNGGYTNFLEKLSECGLGGEKILGIIPEYTDLRLHLFCKERLGISQWEDISPLLRSMRAIKTADEQEMIRKAAELATSAMESAIGILCPGIRERDLAAELEYHMRRNGSDGVPYTIKTLSGLRTAVVQNVPEENEIREGDLVLIDIGATYRGYSSDWTRTFCMGQPSQAQQELYQTVWDIERACIDLVSPGRKVSELFDKVRHMLQGSKYEKYFNPFLGHSLGICSPEWPSFVPTYDGSLEEGMVITLEPGIYVPEIGGVRIEDDMLVTSSGAELLTGLKKEIFSV